jgi:hypothetical protein
MASDVETIITVAKVAYAAYEKFLSGNLSVRQATDQIIAAINGAKIEIINHIDAIAAAEARSCAQDAVLGVESFNILTLDNQQAFALAATSCVNRIDILVTTLTSKAAIDQLGFTLQAVGPIMLIVRSRVGFSNTNFVPILVRSTQRVITALTPTCTSRTIEGRTQWTCRSYNGDRGGPDPSPRTAEQTAGRGTSWALGRAVLPQLSNL